MGSGVAGAGGLSEGSRLYFLFLGRPSLHAGRGAGGCNIIICIV